MWTFFEIATVGGLLTYPAEGDFGLLDNILNTADIIRVGTVAIRIALFGDRSTRFDLGCLVAVWRSRTRTLSLTPRSKRFSSSPTSRS